IAVTPREHSEDDQRLKSPDSSPLDFLLGLMKGPQVSAHLRFRVASIAAPYVHGKPVRAVKDTTSIEDPHGFHIDLKTAKAFRADKRWLAQLIANPRFDGEKPGAKK